MITGDNSLTAVRVAKEVEIVDWEVLIPDIAENATSEKGLAWRTIDESLLQEYDICMTGVVLKQLENLPA
ncbi:hypothetical protein BDY19DRAFT_997562 [Irpex rosettiformis]|uniref:Uncharacterized protein n=1 Tax=Irpex rosettiformis TaxID=378272 RepID=A0ACB8TRP3_9APHY|nr:hypothetical protein BDY19DRAFT_997562 [Irpex rosettiformis]